MNTRYTGPIRFSLDDLELFSAASHDRNPLHLSEAYARKTAYAERVVFGVLGGLICLGQLRERPDCVLSHLTLEFSGPLFLNQDYAVVMVDDAPEQATAKVYDGKQLVLKLTAQFKSGAGVELEEGSAQALRTEAVDWPDAELTPGRTIAGTYSPVWAQLHWLMQRAGLTGKAIGEAHVAALLWASYLIGMELPGRRALFSSLSLNFTEAGSWRGSPLAYQAKVAAYDRRFDRLKVEAHLSVAGRPLAEAELRAFVRRETPATDLASIEALLPRSDRLTGKVALVIGASRGLGAALAAGLASQGCTVIANFLKSEDEANQLEASLAAAPGRLELSRGDGGDLAWCQDAKAAILARYGRLDFLVCNASLPLLPLRLDPVSVERVNAYVARSLALVSVPLSVFLDTLSETSGWAVVLSSSAVQAPPADWPHYVSAKYAIEGLTHTAAAAQRAVRFLIARPPRLLTDLTNTPLGSQGALPPANVAAKIVLRLMGDAASGGVETLEDFS